MNARKGTSKHADNSGRRRGRVRRRVSAGVASLVLATAAMLGTAGPAAAADGILLSLDGTSWSPALTGALFTSPSRVVPGDVSVATLWARNASSVTARLTLHAADGIGSGSADLAGHLTLRVDGAAVAGGSTWSGPVLAPGQQASVTLEVAFDTAATVGTLSAASVVDMVMLTQAVSGGPSVLLPTDDDDVPTHGSLAATGAQVRELAGIAIVSVTFGAVLVWRRRRGVADDL
ncbi:hypothetical protein [Cellulomonas sp. URHD0024]|uniref:hypothetical protein n=1 Tax=Cellulomonas sp. URHD0024 TaxID=1302620 RepID=UPI0003F5B8DD|nr:hypothetical protein [Cellulomonas sp. URHD0024]